MDCDMTVEEHFDIFAEAFVAAGLGGKCRKEQAALQELCMLIEKIHGPIPEGGIDDPTYVPGAISDHWAAETLQWAITHPPQQKD